MPSKNEKKSSSSSKDNNKTEKSIDDDDINKLAEIEAKHKELIQRASFLKKRSTREKVEKEEFEKRLEKLKFYWDIEKNTLESKREEYRKRQEESEQIKISHRLQIDSIKEGIKEQLYQQEHELTRTKNHFQREIQGVENQHAEAQKAILSGVKEYENRLKEVQISHQNFMVQLRKEHEDRITLSRDDFKFRSKEISKHSERQDKQMRDEIEKRNKKEVKEWEDEKETQTRDKIKAHEAELEDIRTEYSTKLHNILDKIKEFKTRNLEQKKQLRQTEKHRRELESKNKKIIEPLAQAQIDIKELGSSCEEFKKEKNIMSRRKKEFVTIEGELKEAQWRHEVLFQRYQRIEEERDDCHQLFEKSLLDLQQRNSFSALLMNKKMKELFAMCKAHVNVLMSQVPSDTKVSDEFIINTKDNSNECCVTMDDLERIFAQIKDCHMKLLGSVNIRKVRMGRAPLPVSAA